MSVDRREPTGLKFPLMTGQSPTSEVFNSQLNDFLRSINSPINVELVRTWSPLIIWQGFDMDNMSTSVSLVPIEVDEEFKTSEALVRLNHQDSLEKGQITSDDLCLSVVRSGFGSGFYIGERTMLLSWFKSACIAIQDCISPKAIQACLKSAVEAAQRDADGRKIKLDRIGPPIHREFCRQLSIARYGGY